MSKSRRSEPTPTPVRTVTKHIKIYSDNPIHDCIARMIGYCEYLDKPEVNTYFAFKWMREAALELASRCSSEASGKSNYFEEDLGDENRY